jgi:peptidoglycan hydrolase FlgJ
MESMPINKTGKAPEAGSRGNDPGSRKIDREKLKKACSDFEALFLARMLKVMRQSVPSSGLWGNGPGKEIYDSFMDQELSKKMARREGLGLGKRIYNQVLKREEKSEPLSTEGQLRAAGRKEEVNERAGRSSAAGLSDDRR